MIQSAPVTSSTPISLLWPDAPQPFDSRCDDAAATDLNLNALVRALSIRHEYQRSVRAILLNLCPDPDVIRYRQAIVHDLLRSPQLVAQLERILETIVDLENYLTTPQWTQHLLRQVAWRLSELESYVECVMTLHDLLAEAGDAIQSTGLQRLRHTIHTIVHDDTFQMLREELPTLLPRIRAVRSITIGINLDEQMRPLSATLLGAHQQAVGGESLMSRLFGRRRGVSHDADPAEQRSGVGDLHDARHLNMGGHQLEVELEDRNSPFMPPLFKDLSELMDATSRPIAQALKKYLAINSQFLIALKAEIAFYLGAIHWINALRERGLSLCQPHIMAQSTREMHLQGMYNVNLARQLHDRHEDLSEFVVCNDVHFDEAGRIFILTGPNQGGKTTYTQAIGLAQVLGQAGLPVPATEARMSAVDGIYTHFATEERPEFEAGRLGEEAKRLHTIFQRATRHSLVLLNESLASTSATESVYLARDVVRVLRVLGARAIFATHLHELAAQCDALNAETTGESRIISVVSEVHIEQDAQRQVVRRTYRIAPGPPVSKSYAVELAARYGISYDQLTALLQQRQVLDSPDTLHD